MIQDNYYFLTIRDYPRVASAYAPDNSKLAHEIIPELEGKNELPFELKLVKLLMENNRLIKSNDLSGLDYIWLDFQPNSLAWPLMSERFKNLIIEWSTGKECINWITAKIVGNGECRVYYIPRFERMLDVLNINQTLFVKGTDHIIRPHFSLEKIKEFAIFNRPSANDLWKITSGLYINERLKKEIIKEKLIGPAFEKVRAS